MCSGCNGPRDRGRQHAYCRTCHNEYAQTNRPKHSELDPEAKRRANCRSYTNVLIRRGVIAKTPCACGSCEELQARQRGDYTDPYDVEFVCKPCRSGHRHVVAA